MQLSLSCRGTCQLQIPAGLAPDSVEVSLSTTHAYFILYVDQWYYSAITSVGVHCNALLRMQLVERSSKVYYYSNPGNATHDHTVFKKRHTQKTSETH